MRLLRNLLRDRVEVLLRRQRVFGAVGRVSLIMSCRWRGVVLLLVVLRVVQRCVQI